MDLNSMKDKAADLLRKHPDQAENTAEKVGEFVKGKFGHGEQVDSAVDKIKDWVPGGETSGSEQPAPPPERQA